MRVPLPRLVAPCLAAGFAAIAFAGASVGLAAGEEAARPLRLHGLVEPVRSYAVTAPRLAASQAGGIGQLVVVRLARAGSLVTKGDTLVEFDRRNQLTAARDREAEYRNFVEQIRKKAAEQRVGRAHRATELAQAENAVKTAELDLRGVDLLPAIEAEKNQQALEEAQAHLAALRRTEALRDKVDAAELRTLEIQRDRAENGWRHARTNADRMLVIAPIDGLVVLRSVWKSGVMAVVQEGEEMRPGLPVLDVVDPSAMRVRAQVRQPDVTRLTIGQPVRVTLDSYPSRSFRGRLEQLSPVATTSTLNPRGRAFLALFSIAESDPHLLPDLAAAIDVGAGAEVP
ncbi:MAG: HlyD family secretion protein [Vicinamibacterales bacterium]